MTRPPIEPKCVRHSATRTLRGVFCDRADENPQGRASRLEQPVPLRAARRQTSDQRQPSEVRPGYSVAPRRSRGPAWLSLPCRCRRRRPARRGSAVWISPRAMWKRNSPHNAGKGPRFSQLIAQNVRARVGHLNVGRRPVLGGKQGRTQGDLQGELFAGALWGVRQGREQLYSPAREHHGS